MRRSLVAFVVLSMFGSASAETPPTAGAPADPVNSSRMARDRTDRMLAPAQLADVKAIRAWAEHASFGGNQTDLLTFGTSEVVVVRRAFSSGIQTCGLNVFIPTKDGWEPSLALRPVSGFWLKVTQDGDAVRIANSRTGVEVARFSIVGLQANPALNPTGLRPAG